jgi:hypothetical protein
MLIKFCVWYLRYKKIRVIFPTPRKRVKPLNANENKKGD